MTHSYYRRFIANLDKNFFPNFKHCNLGLIAKEECAKTECTSSQESDPVGNNCFINDGYLRTMLYRAWLPSCPILDLYNTNEKWYVLDHHGTWRYGETAVIRCFPGFQLNNVTQVNVKYSILAVKLLSKNIVS